LVVDFRLLPMIKAPSGLCVKHTDKGEKKSGSLAGLFPEYARMRDFMYFWADTMARKTRKIPEPVNLSVEARWVRETLGEYSRSTDFLLVVDDWAVLPERVKGLVDLAVSGDVHPFPQYASHLLLHVARKNPKDVAIHHDQLLDGVLATDNTSVKRNGLGALLCLPIQPYREGDLLDWLFKVFQDPASQPGLISYTARKLADFVSVYPELKDEVLMALEWRADMTGDRGLMVLKRFFR
jgi:hypothetical protein